MASDSDTEEFYDAAEDVNLVSTPTVSPAKTSLFSEKEIFGSHAEEEDCELVIQEHKVEDPTVCSGINLSFHRVPCRQFVMALLCPSFRYLVRPGLPWLLLPFCRVYIYIHHSFC